MLRMKMQVVLVNLKTSGAVTYFKRCQSQFEDLRKLQFLRKGSSFPFLVTLLVIKVHTKEDFQ